jgi:hypothetical protein
MIYQYPTNALGKSDLKRWRQGGYKIIVEADGNTVPIKDDVAFFIPEFKRIMRDAVNNSCVKQGAPITVNSIPNSGYLGRQFNFKATLLYTSLVEKFKHTDVLKRREYGYVSHVKHVELEQEIQKYSIKKLLKISYLHTKLFYSDHVDLFFRVIQKKISEKASKLTEEQKNQLWTQQDDLGVVPDVLSYIERPTSHYKCVIMQARDGEIMFDYDIAQFSIYLRDKIKQNDALMDIEVPEDMKRFSKDTISTVSSLLGQIYHCSQENNKAVYEKAIETLKQDIEKIQSIVNNDVGKLIEIGQCLNFLQIECPSKIQKCTFNNRTYRGTFIDWDDQYMRQCQQALTVLDQQVYWNIIETIKNIADEDEQNRQIEYVKNACDRAQLNKLLTVIDKQDMSTEQYQEYKSFFQEKFFPTIRQKLMKIFIGLYKFLLRR